MKFKKVSERVITKRFFKTWKVGGEMWMPKQFWRPWGLWYRLIAGAHKVKAEWNR